MAASQPYGVSCRGGLNTNLNQLEILAKPGLATKLVNFEVDPDGGYRRINGYTAFGDTRPNGSNDILGLSVYADGLIACSGEGIFFSPDGEDAWLQINKASVSDTGDNYTTFLNRSVASRTNQGHTSFAVFEGNTDYGQITIVDGSNKPFLFSMSGTGALETRTFFAEEIEVTGNIAPKVCALHDSHLVVAGATGARNTVYYSATLDPSSFSAAGSGAILLPDQVVGIRSFRTDLIIFCRNSIHKLVNINDASNIAIIPITQNVGCLSAGSIQEIGGDLVFLSPDGIRTVAGTTRIGDVELGSVSRQIQSIIAELAKTVNSYTITSAVLRSKSQYRLFYTTVNGQTATSKGVIGTLTAEGYEWSETRGIQATGFASGFNGDGVEKLYHGDNEGYVYNHNDGDSFSENGSLLDISASFQTPYYDFGDVGTQKTIQYVKLSVTPEGEVAPVLKIRYDYEDPLVPQPAEYILETILEPSVFGTAVFGVNKFGAGPDPMVRQAVQGSGTVASIQVTSSDQRKPYAINGLYINYVPSGRR